MPGEKPITVHGVTYASISEACRVLGRKLGKVSYRLQAGYTPEEAFSEKSFNQGSRKKNELGPSAKGRPITVRGRRFASIKEACEALDFDYGMASRRLSCGWDADDAFSRVVFPREKGTAKSEPNSSRPIGLRSMDGSDEPQFVGGHMGARFDK